MKKAGVIKKAIAVFAKAPIAGQVKTRLIGTLTPEEAKDLYICFLKDTFEFLEELLEEVQEENEDDELSLVLCFTPADELEAFEAADLNGCLMLAQSEGDLGERMKNCFDDLFKLKFQSVVIIGADTPTLPTEIISEAFTILTEDKNAVTIGATVDGGYYLMGMNSPHPALFENITWGSDQVMLQTRQQAETINLQLSMLPEWFDIDSPDDLERLKLNILAKEAEPYYTKRFLKKLHSSQ
jgi:uncharacterized protein